MNNCKVKSVWVGGVISLESYISMHHEENCHVQIAKQINRGETYVSSNMYVYFIIKVIIWTQWYIPNT